MARDYYDESKNKKKTTQKAATKTKSQSSSVSKAKTTTSKVNKTASKSTFLGGGASTQAVKKATTNNKPKTVKTQPTKQERINQKMYGSTTAPERRTKTTTSNTQRNVETKVRQTVDQARRTRTEAQQQKLTGGVDAARARKQTQEIGREIKSSLKNSFSDENRAFAQRQKSGILTEADKKKVEQRDQRRAQIVKNTGAVAKKAVQDTVSGYGQSLADVDEMVKSNKNWTKAKAQKMGIDLNDKAKVSKVEQERQQSIKEAREFRQELFNKQEKRQAEWDERTKNAKGLEKAWYGAVESGTGMLADTAVGAVTGTGQFGALASMGLRTYGSSANQARKEGATDKEARLYGLAQSAKEVGTELMFQGAGLAKAAYGKTGLSLADKSANVLTRGLTGIKADAVGAGVRALGGTAEENIEELAGWMADPLIKELTYGKAVRNRMKENLRSNIPQIGSDADAANVASYFSTPKFTDDLTNEYVKSGMSKDKASALAAEMRDYYVAYYSGDKGKMDALEEDLAAKLSGQDKLSYKSWSMDELKDTFASTTLLTLATGIPGAVNTSVKGNQIFDSDEVKAVFGNDAVRKVADAVKNTSNKEMSLKADVMKQRLDSGKDLTGTQKFDLYQGYIEKVNDTAKKARASQGVVENAREEQDLVPTMGVDRAGNVVYAKETQREYDEKYASTAATAEALRRFMESDNSISDDEIRRTDAAIKAVSDLHVGGLTIGDAHEFAYGNELARETLKAEEGIDLNRYIVRDANGNVDLAATNEATENALFEINAANAIKAAQAETEVYIDDTRGNIDKDLLTRFGNSGQAAWKEVNKDLDPRDLKNYLTTANAASYFYSAGRNTDMSVDTAIDRYADTFKTVDNSVLEKAFAAGAEDRIIANTPGYGQTVESGSNIQLKKTEPIITGQLIMDDDVVIPDSDQSAYLALAMSTNSNIHIVGNLNAMGKDGKPIINQATGLPVQLNGMSHGNEIYLNMNASAEQNLGYVFMHEMTHQIKQYAPNEYLALENLVRDKWFNKDAVGMQAAIKQRMDLYSTKGGQQLTEEEAVEEIIADAMAEAMDDPNFAAEVCEQDINLGQQILDGIRAALRSIRQMFANSDVKNDRFHNSLLSYLGILDEAEKMWLNALATARQNKADGLIADWQDKANKQNAPRLSVAEEQKESIETSFENTVSEADRTALYDMGVDVTESGTAVKYSLNSWEDTDQEALLEKLTKAGFDRDAARKWIRQVNSVASIIYGDMERLNYEADQYQNALKANSEYYFTLDMSTLCQKRRLYQGTYNAIMHKLVNRSLYPEDTVRLREMMEQMGLETPCGICYEESRKKNEGKFADTWLNGQTDKEWNQKLKEYDKKLEKYKKKLAEYEALENKGKKKPPKEPQKPERWLGYANMEHSDPFIPTLADVTTTDGRARLREEHPEALEAYLEYQKGRGSANPKVSFTHTDYRGDILRMTATDIENVKHIGGLRIQSFSDFETIHVIDMMQAIMDMATMKLASQAYTKVPAFADIFGGTGVKINLSLIQKMDESGNPVYDKKGRLVFDSKEGIDPKEAFRIRKKYSKNVGTILVGVSTQQILDAWADDRVDMVIPFHRSGWSLEEFERLGLKGYEDFQDYQSERYLDPKTNKWISLADAKKEAIYSADYWNKNLSGKENAELYLKKCAELHYRPVFYNFLHDNGDGTWSLQEDGSTDGYWKSLIDYKMYDNEGSFAPQEEVQPIFDMRAAKKYMAAYEGDPDTLPVNNDVVEAYIKDYKERHPDAKIDYGNDARLSISVELDDAYNAAVESNNMDEAQRLVDEAAGIAGMRVAHRWHGSMNANFTVFSKRKANVEGNSGAGFYFTTNEDDATNHYKDSEGADNFFKVQSFADYLMQFEEEWNGVKIDSDETAKRVATEELNKNPGVFDVYLNYKEPYVRNYKDSTNIYDKLVEDVDFDESDIDRDDYDEEYEYEDAVWEARSEALYSAIDDAVRWAYNYLEDNYDYTELPDISELVGSIAEDVFDGHLTWDDISNAVGLGEVTLENDDRIGDEVQWGATELTRAIIEGFGYDAVQDKEVDSKFGQLSREMMTGTEHIIVFRPEQIKLSDPVTYAEDGSVIPLSERFDPTNNDIRYSLPTQDSEGNILTDGQMEYFKNSQARDEQGRLVKVFHTTNYGGFTIFDPSYSDDKRSLFFASNWDVSQTYGYKAKAPINLTPTNRVYATWAEVENDIKNRFPELIEEENMISPFLPPETIKTSEALNAFVFHKNDHTYADELGVEEGFDKWVEMSENGEDTSDYYVMLTVPKAQGSVDIRADSLAELLTKLANELDTGQGKQRGYYSCYLNLENPLIVDAQNQSWNNIPYGEYSEDAVLAIKNLTVQDMGDGIYVNIWGDRKVDGKWQEFRESDTIEFEYLTVDGEYEIPERAWDEVYDFLVKQGLSSDYAYEHSDAFFDFNGLDTFDKDGKKVESDVRRYRTRELAALADAKGYDSVIIRNCYDIGAASHLKGEGLSDIYIAFSSNQVKDAANENPTENPDIRYSIVDEDEAMSHMAHDYAYDTSYEALAYYEDLIAADASTETTYEKAKNYIAKDVDEFYAGLTRYADGMKFDDPVLEEGRTRMARSKQDYFNSNVAKWNDAWLTDGEVLDPKSIKKPVKDLVTAVMSESNTNKKYKTDLVNKAIIDIRLAYFYAKKGRTDVADALLWHSAHRMIDGVEFYADDTSYEEYKGLRDYMKNTRIQLGEEYWSDVDFGAFRKENFGRMNLVKGETNVDKIYAELEDMYPGLFDSEEYDNAPDQLMHMASVLDSVQPYAEAYSSEYCAEWATDIASDLLDIMQNGKELQSIADRYTNKYEAKIKAMKARHAEAMLKVRQQRDEGINAQKAKFKEYKEQQKEKKAHNKSFESIQKTHKKLTERLLTNTADKNIPEQYKRDLARLLAAFDLQTVGSKKYEMRTGRQGQKTIKMAALKTALTNIENKSHEFHVSDAITDIIDELLGKNAGAGYSRSIEGLTIDELSTSELDRIDKLLKALLHEFNTYRNVKIGAKRQQTEDIGKAQVDSALEHAKMFGAGKDYQNIPGGIDRIINLDEVTPAYMFKHIDPEKSGLGLMFKELRRSFDKYVKNQEQLNEWMNDIVGKYHKQSKLPWRKYGAGELENWRSENYSRTFNLESGDAVTLTPAQMMSLYCLSKRTQAYNHMTGAGIVVAPVSFNAKILSDLKKKANTALPKKLTDADIKQIVTQLTPDQIKVAEDLQQLMAERMAAWGNEASMNVLGIELFGEPDYFPIKSDKAALEKDLNENEFVEAIRNFGFTKAVQPGARNAIMVDDIFDVVTEHCNNMNLYNAYSESINDFMKVYNYRDFRDDGSEYTVQQAIAHAYGSKATTFIMTFMRDLNGNVSGRASGIENLYNSLLGNAKKAAVFANLRVAAQQPTAITRAFAVIDPKYLKGIKIENGAMDELFEHCPIALWKSWGYYDINMGKSIEDIMMNNGRWLEDAATELYGALDNVTWTAIWQMVKAEMKDTHPDVKVGSDEYWELCNERMTEVVDLTQVVDSPFHRSHAMRDKGIFVKAATSFMAEPTLTFNMLRDGIIRSREAWKKGDKAEAAKIAAKIGAVALLQAATVAGAASLVDALRHKRPDKDDEDERFLHLWWVNALENFHDELKVWNKIYFVKDIASIFDGWDNSNLALQGIQKFALGYRQLTEDPYARSSATWYENMADGIGYMTGVPVKTVRTGLKNAMGMLGVSVSALDSVGEKLDSVSLKKDEGETGMIGKLLGLVLSDEGDTLLDKYAKKKGYRKIEKGNEDTGSEKTSEGGETEEPEKREQLDYDTMLNKALKAAEGYEGEEYNQRIYSSVAQGMKGYIADGDYVSIGMMRTVIEQAGGDVNYFDQRVMEETKSAYKKSLKYDMSYEERWDQKAMYRYMMQHGMSQEELSSEILYKSDLAKDMKVAYRIGDNDIIYEAMVPLVDAGMTQTDLDRLYENRNRMDLTKYKQNGRFKDKLKSMGTFIWPTDGVITSHFGYRNAPTAGASSNHPAIDIGAPQGTTVVAADGGVIIYAGTNSGYGNSVGIKHDNGMVTYYNHLYSYNVNVGDTVAQGQQIAKVGSTGISTGPHLDFKILDKNGKPVDPEKYLQ